VPVWTWACLGLFCAVVVPTGLVALVRGVQLWRKVAALERTVGRPLEMLAVKVDELNAHTEATNARTAELNANLLQLDSSLRKIAVLQWALGDTRDALALWRILTRK
jgi:hypothetical protein